MTTVSPEQPPSHTRDARNWFAVVTTPQHEKAAFRHLDSSGIEAFLPTCESSSHLEKQAESGSATALVSDLSICPHRPKDRVRVLRTPGVRRLVGNSREPLSLADREVEFLRKALCRQKAEPYADLVSGERVRIGSGAMQGLEGWLVRKTSGWRFILSVQLIHQLVAVEVDASSLIPAIAY